MVKVDVAPPEGVVTLGTAAGVMILRDSVTVAVGTVGENVVVEPILSPIHSIVAIITFVVVVVEPAMAVRTLGEASVVERDLVPVDGVVTVGALAGVMIDWRLVVVTCHAVVIVVVAVRDLVPVGRVVAKGALAGVGILLLRMAALAIRKVGVIKPRLLPVCDVVTVGALAGVMAVRIVLLEVAGQAIGESGVIEGDILPVIRAEMAIHTRPWNGMPGKRSLLLVCRGL